METTLEQETREEFHIDNEAAALWYLRKLANIEAEQKRVKRQAQALLDSLNADAESLKRLYQSELEHWARGEMEARRKKTLHTLQGTLRFRTVPARLAIEDPSEAFLACLEEQWEGCIETKEALIPSEFLKLAQERLEAHGELVRGVVMVPERESFSVSFAKEEEN